MCILGFDAGAFVSGVRVIANRFIVCAVEVSCASAPAASWNALCVQHSSQPAALGLQQDEDPLRCDIEADTAHWAPLPAPSERELGVITGMHATRNWIVSIMRDGVRVRLWGFNR